MKPWTRIWTVRWLGHASWRCSVPGIPGARPSITLDSWNHPKPGHKRENCHTTPGPNSLHTSLFLGLAWQFLGVIPSLTFRKFLSSLSPGIRTQIILRRGIRGGVLGDPRRLVGRGKRFGGRSAFSSDVFSIPAAFRSGSFSWTSNRNRCLEVSSQPHPDRMRFYIEVMDPFLGEEW